MHEYFAVQMVNFVLNAHGEQFVAFHFKKFAFCILRAHAHAIGAGDGLVNFGYGQTAFFPLFLFDALCDDFGIDEDQRLIALLRGIHDDDAMMNVHQRCGQAHAFGAVHGLKHIVDCGLQRYVKRADRLGNGVQTRIREL